MTQLQMENKMMKKEIVKETTRVIDLTKYDSLINKRVIEYREVPNPETLLISVEVYLNGRKIGAIGITESRHARFVFNADGEIVTYTTGENLKEVKDKIEKRIVALFDDLAKWC